MGPMQCLNVSMSAVDSLTSQKCKRQHMPMEFSRLNWSTDVGLIRGINLLCIWLINNICLTSVTRAKLNDKMAFPA